MMKRILTIIILMLVPFFAEAAGVVINEIGWSGTKASSFGEWIELYNNSDAGVTLDGWVLYEGAGVTKIISLAGTIEPRAFYLIERTTPSSPDPLAGVIVDRKGPFGGNGLLNTGEDLSLVDVSSTTVDSVKFSTQWPAGTLEPDYISMERIDPKISGSKASNWASNNGKKMNGKDVDGNPIHGTPRFENSVMASAKVVPPPAPIVEPAVTTLPQKGKLASGISISDAAPQKGVAESPKPVVRGAAQEAADTSSESGQAGDDKSAVEGNGRRGANAASEVRPDERAVANIRASSASFMSSKIFLLASIGLGLFGSIGFLILRSL